ncbi:Hpr(Ser) kinase/phosphatase [Tistrella mobilis]
MMTAPSDMSAFTLPDIPDLDIRRVDELPAHLDGATAVNAFVEAMPDRLLIRMPGIGRFLAEEGRRLLMAGAPGVSDDELAYFAIRTPLTAVIQQRGEVALHAACLVPPDGGPALAITGLSGAGKSLMAGHLLRRGWHFVADEVVRLTVDGDGRPMVWPGTPVLALWPDTARMLDLNPAELPPTRPGHSRVLWRTKSVPTPVVLGHVVLLDRGEEKDVVAAMAIDRIRVLATESFRLRQLRAMGRQAAHMALISRVAARLRVLSLGAAKEPPPDQLCARVIAWMSEAGK